jgi:hypothetical protein
MSVSRKNKSMKKSSKSRKNIKSSRKTRKNIRKMRGGRKGRRNMKGGVDHTQEDKINTTNEFNIFIDNINKNENYEEEELEMADKINDTVALDSLNLYPNFFTRINLSNNTNLINRHNLIIISKLLSNPTNKHLIDLELANCFSNNTEIDLKLFITALGNNKSLKYIDLSNNKLFDLKKPPFITALYENISKHKKLEHIKIDDHIITKQEFLSKYKKQPKNTTPISNTRYLFQNDETL